MRAGSRFLATVFAGIVWVIAGFSVASGPLAYKAIAPTVLDATANCRLNAGP